MLVKQTKKYIFSGAILLTILVAVFLLSPDVVLAQSGYGDDIAWGGVQEKENVGIITGLGNEDPRVVIANVIRIFLGFLGIIAVLLIMYAGWMYMSSQGDEGKIQQAKDTLKNAFIGLLIILSAFAIATFIFNMLLNGSGGNNQYQTQPGRVGGGMGALGACALEMVYPLPNQREVPRNTAIIVTFQEPINEEDICGETSCVSGEDIDSSMVKIFKTDIGVSDALADEDVTVYSSDGGKTFVFIPDDYLGSATSYTGYTVLLSEEIRKREENISIFQKCPGSSNYWSFEVSNKIDLTPPQVRNGGVFPAPDNWQDASSTAVSSQSSGSVEVDVNPTPYMSGTASTSPLTADIEISNEESCIASGNLTLTIFTDNKQVQLSDNSGDNLGMEVIVDEKVSFDNYFDVEFINGHNAGSQWTVVATREIFADYIRVGNNNYLFGDDIVIGASTDITTTNIITTLNSDPKVSAQVDGGNSSRVIVTSIVLGASGDNINLSSSDSQKFTIEQMDGGEDGKKTIIYKGKPDEPMNTIVQVSFNEPIMPMLVSGEADAIFDNIQVQCIGGDCPTTLSTSTTGYFNCNGSICVDGIFTVSNMYRTVEFRSTFECGVNGCGEKIYCLPENSQLEVVLGAATLSDCGGDDCVSRSPYSTCSGGHCMNTDNEFYPLSIIPFNGVMDVALNSMDGDRSGDAEGPDTIYYENDLIATCPDIDDAQYYNVCNTNNADNICFGGIANCEYPSGDEASSTRRQYLQGITGDNYAWYFFVNDILDTTPPAIERINTIVKGGNIEKDENVEVVFDKVMMSSSLSTGSYSIHNGKDYVAHRRINMWGKNGSAVGYYVLSENQDGNTVDLNPEWTNAYINHSILMDFTTYRSQVGSGVKDIRQNCFKPSEGPNPVSAVPAPCGTDGDLPSCCNGAPVADLNSEGNCNN